MIRTHRPFQSPDTGLHDGEKNYFKPGFPSGDHAQLKNKLGIPAGATVLDVGGGDNPFKYATVVVDLTFGRGTSHRDGRFTPLHKTGMSYVQADIHHLPFPDKTFDFVICMHVLEHVMFPARACKELVRVARKGFVETPRKWSEHYAGHPTHRWLVDEHDETLIFEPVKSCESLFMNFALPVLWESPELARRFLTQYSNIPCVQLAWHDTFNWQITAPLPPDADHPEIMGKRHYDFARNMLFWMGPFKKGAFHANTALNLNPRSDKYRHLAGIYALLTGDVKTLRRVRPGMPMLITALLCAALKIICRTARQWYWRIIRFQFK